MHPTIIFDLDGTIADSESVFFRIVNELAPDFGYAPVDSSQVRQFKELSLRDLLFKQLGWRILYLPWILRRARERYHAVASEVPIFPGIREVIATLHKRGYRIGIVSSSKQNTIRSILEKHGMTVEFVTESSLFGKVRALKGALREYGITPANALYIGDEVRDVEACQKTGIRIIAVTWGLNSKGALTKAGAETVATSDELLARILSKDSV